MHQEFGRLQWIGVAIFVSLNIAYTNQTPTKLAARDGPPAPRPKPVMGWNSFYPSGCGANVNRKDLLWHADMLDQKGFIKAGYKTFIVECGWERDLKIKEDYKVEWRPWKKANWSLQLPDKPDTLAANLNPKGLGLGLGTWGGKQICPRTKDEGSGVKPLSYPDAYVTYLVNVRGAAYLSHRPLGTNSTGQWGASPKATKTEVNSQRIADDTVDSWNSLIRTINALYPYSLQNQGPYNDLGWLQVGENKLSMVEKITQFSFWAAAKSPLIFSSDISRLGQAEIDTLRNPGAIAINQDDLGQTITLKHRYSADMDVWSGPLKDGNTVAVIISWSNDATTKNIRLDDLGFSSAHIFDVMTGKDLGVINEVYTSKVEAHGSLFLKLTETKPAPEKKFITFPAEQAEMIGSAQIRSTSRGVKVVSNLQADGKSALRWNNVPGSKSGWTLVKFAYINAELSPGNMDDSKLNFKHTSIVINGNNEIPFYSDMPITGLTWDDMAEGFLVSLPLKSPKTKI
ncbi:uncharacterized protein PGTG_05915 [Puccinia graminis f. sp. tritici CRL 75-36-700-3]|uniref:Alpha-galactosidase n=1 Tax=Puccinia graminis f. sp. tritici (strain CRL 75-36-700-3 / race SCCL) TaxID=418459 RepID=E3K623_PUCGT|nr:uncharacterized protein PGTG_05915 [Puccinia graminis f. sp. tritici CRL 75-36-700-3]EFP79594.1 hypothetical protein PGTG_05915 [Puccinia graminis f. sp. tritici CRL 75-36-700-3]